MVGLLGCRFLIRDRTTTGRGAFLRPAERAPCWLLFGGVALTGIGSAYYHWSPDNATLFWDRLPMTIAFMALLSSVIAERVNLTLGLRLLGPLLVLGMLSTLYWHVGETLGVGDLRPYALVQFGSLIMIPLIAWLFPPRYTGTADLFRVAGWYGLAKVFGRPPPASQVPAARCARSASSKRTRRIRPESCRSLWSAPGGGRALSCGGRSAAWP